MEGDGEFQGCREKLSVLHRKLQKKLDNNMKTGKLLDELGKTMGHYAKSYGKSAYPPGFYDGMQTGPVAAHRQEGGAEEPAGIGAEDMAHILYQ